jgi:hypothetical protein
MNEDPGEKENLYTKLPNLVQKLLSQLTDDVNNGKTIKNSNHKNDSKNITLWKIKEIKKINQLKKIS